jgi:hypothetical protein
VDPLREGLQVREHPVDRAVGEAALPVLVQLAAQIVDELAGDPRRPAQALLGADLTAEEGDEQPEVPRLLLPGPLPRRDLEAEVVLCPQVEGVVFPALPEASQSRQ